MSDTARICICGHWENWHVNGSCELCTGKRDEPRHEFKVKEVRRIIGPVGKDLHRD